LTNQEQFYEKLSAEYDAFVDRLKAKTPDEILAAAYEKVCKDEILIIFENSEYSEDNYAALLRIEKPLDAFYREWLDTDATDMEAIRDCVVSTVKRETGVELNAETAEKAYDAAAWRDLADREESDVSGDYTLEERIAAEIVAKSESAAQVINGEVNYGDWVIVKPDEHYGCLVGQVTAIDKLGTDEHDTGNENDDIHINFIALEYSETTKAELLEALDGLYPDAARFDDIPLDDVIMAPDSLISLVGLDFESIDKLSASYKAAREFGNRVLSEHFNGLETQLIERVEQNYADFNQSLLSLSKWDVIEKAAVIHAYSDAESYLTAYHNFSDDELRFYTQFVNPLEVVVDAWHKRNIDLEDMSGTMDFVYEQRDTHLAVYPLINDKPEPEKPQEQLKTAPAKEKSAFDKALNRGREKSEAYKAQKAQEPAADKKKHEERG